MMLSDNWSQTFCLENFQNKEDNTVLLDGKKLTEALKRINLKYKVILYIIKILQFFLQIFTWWCITNLNLQYKIS